MNIASQYSKLDEIYSELVIDKEYDIIALTETWLHNKVDNSDITLDGYQPPFRSDRQGRGGGTLIYVKCTLSVIRCPELETGPNECTWLELLVQGKKLYFGVYYRPPGQSAQDKDTFLECFQNTLDTIYSKQPFAIICTGDFNDRCSSWTDDHVNSELGMRLRDLISYNNMFQLITDPTHTTDTCKSLLDLIFTDSPAFFIEVGTGEAIADHLLIFGKIDLHPKTSGNHTRTVWHYRHANYDDLNDELSGIDWYTSFNNLPNIDSMVDYMTTNIKAAAMRHIPYKKIRINTKDKPWMTANIKHLLRLRNRWNRNYNKNPTAYNKSIRNEHRKLVKQEIQQAKDRHFQRQSDLIGESSHNPKRYWSLVKSLMGNKVNRCIPTLTQGDTYFCSAQDKAEHLNDYFASQTKLDIPNNFSLPQFSYLTDHRLEQITIRNHETLKALKDLNTNKATGPDEIGNMILKNISQSIYKPLTTLLNKSLEAGIFPNQWKRANVVPVHKKSDRSSASNYRPISLLPNLSKVFERVVFNRLYEYLDKNKLLTTLNSGFKKRDGTINQLVNIVDKIYKALDNHQDVCMVFLDISKAFDKVFHQGLLHKMRQLGIDGKLLKWLCSYLSDRKQRVSLEGKCSQWQVLGAGVPQGSILGPLLFLIFVNDIVYDIQSDINLFADDTSLLKAILDPVNCFKIISDDLSRLSTWAKQWLVTFNASKTVYMILSLKRKIPNYPPLIFNNTTLEKVESHTHLGMTFNTMMTWHDHINRIIKKAHRTLNVIKRIQHLVPRTILERLYKTLVLPIIEYGNIIYDNTTVELSDKLEKTQKYAAVLCTGAYRLTGYNSLLKELGWENLQTRRIFHRLTLLYKMQNNLVPTYLVNLLPQTTAQRTTYNLRNPTNITLPKTRTKRAGKFFIPKTISEWNLLTQSCKESPSLPIFKARLKQHLFNNKPNPLYCIGSGQTHIAHTRLRLGLSPLKDHLFRRNIVDSNICSFCNLEAETSTHFFLRCPTYTLHRIRLLASLTDIFPVNTIPQNETDLIKIFLSGSVDVSIDTNTNIFNVVHTYIKATCRFKYK